VRLADLVAVRDLELRIVVGGAHVGELSVTAAYITDLPDPSRFLAPGIVVLSSGLWVDRPGGVQRFVGALVAARAAALVLGTVELREVPAEVVDVCRREGLVLATVPDHVSFGSVVEAVVHGAGGEDLRAVDLPGRMQQVLADGSVAGVLHLVSGETAVPTWVLDDGARPVAESQEVTTARRAEVWNAAVRSHTDPRASDGPLGVAGASVFLLPGADPRAPALLVAERDPADLTAHQRSALLALAAAVRPELRYVTRARAAGQQRTADLLAAAAAESLPPGELPALLRVAGLEPRGPLRVVVAETDDARFPAAALVALVEELVGGPGVQVATCVHEGRVTAVLTEPGDVDGGLRERLQPRVGECTPLLAGRRLRLAASDLAVDVGHLAAAHATAVERLRWADSGTAQVRLVDTSSAESHGSLLRMLPARTRAAFAAAVLSPLLEHDARNGAELVTTVEVFLDHAGSWQEAARALHLHPNTLRYRIARAQELTRRDLSSMHDRVDVFLALQCRDSLPLEG